LPYPSKLQPPLNLPDSERNEKGTNEIFNVEFHEDLGVIFNGKGKVKAIPLLAWTGLEVSRRLRLPDFKTIGT